MGVAAGHGVLLELQRRVGVAQHACRQHGREGSRVDVGAALRQHHGLVAQGFGQFCLGRQQRRICLALR
jgi:hypothetical protein